MVKNNIEVDVKIKLLEANLTQSQLGEKNRHDRSVYQSCYEKQGYDSQQDIRSNDGRTRV